MNTYDQYITALAGMRTACDIKLQMDLMGIGDRLELRNLIWEWLGNEFGNIKEEDVSMDEYVTLFRRSAEPLFELLIKNGLQLNLKRVEDSVRIYTLTTAELRQVSGSELIGNDPILNLMLGYSLKTVEDAAIAATRDLYPVAGIQPTITVDVIDVLEGRFVFDNAQLYESETVNVNGELMVARTIEQLRRLSKHLHYKVRTGESTIDASGNINSVLTHDMSNVVNIFSRKD